MIKDKEKFFASSIVICLGALFCCILWGSAVPVIKIGYEVIGVSNDDSASQILFGGLRFTLSGILTLIFGSIINKKIILPKKSSFKYIGVLALFQTILQYIPFYIGVANTTGVKSALVIALGVFFTIFISAVVFRSEKLTKNKILGCVIAFVGIILINMSKFSTGLTAFSFLGDGMIILSNFFYGFSSSFMRKYSKYENPIVLSGCQFFVGGIVMIIVGFILGGKMMPFSMLSVLLLFYLSFVSAAAYAVWSILMKYNPVSKVAIYGFLNPLFGVILSAILLKEYYLLNLSCLIALFFICVGIYISNKSKEKISDHL